MKTKGLFLLPLCGIISKRNKNPMKADIHPEFFIKAIVTCACGATYTVGSTVEKIEVEICSACHPFYTGLEKVLDTTGRVDKFKKRAALAKKA
jgi:large subunit ribosomal protein L31